MLRALILTSGYDPVLVARLARGDRRFFALLSVLSLLAAFVVGVGMADGAELTLSMWAAPVIGVVFFVLTLNLYRLLHAGTGYPIHLPVEDIDTWRPGAAPAVVLFVLGILVTQPLVFLVMSGRLPDGDGTGLIRAARAAWQTPHIAGPLTLVFAVLVSAPAWLRIWMCGPLRAYERERWIDDRLLVDDAFAHAQDAITRLLDRVPGFSGTLQVHYADPPYNTKPLVFGLDPSLLERRNVKWVPYQGPVQPAPHPTKAAPPAPPARMEAPPPPPSPPPSPLPPPPLPTPTPTPVQAPEPEPTPELLAQWDDPSQDDDTGPPALMFFDVGRLQVKRARAHLEELAPFLARFTGRSEDEVRGLVRTAPDDERVHRLFSDYKRLRSILLQDAGFALAHGLAPVVSIVVQRPVADVERRLRAAPRDRRLTGVFAPELARRLLNKQVPSS